MSTITSNSVTSPSVAPLQYLWWLKDPIVPANSMPLSPQPGNFVTGDNFPQQTVNPVGRLDPVVLFDTPKLPTFTMVFVFRSQSAKAQFDGLRSLQRPLLLQGPYPVGQWYVILGASKSDDLMLSSVRSRSATGDVIYNVTISMQAVATP